MDSGNLKNERDKIYVCALTPNGARLGKAIADGLPGSLHLPLGLAKEHSATPFRSMRDLMRNAFQDAGGIVCVMACGIVVRSIPGLLRSKEKDPAIVVVDEKGSFSISLLSGHLGGANELARRVAKITGGVPVITTATDVNGLPAFDELARKRDLIINDLKALKRIHMALLMGEEVLVLDPMGLLEDCLPRDHITYLKRDLNRGLARQFKNIVYIGVKRRGLRVDTFLTLYPRSVLIVGIGCNKGTGPGEIIRAVDETLLKANLEKASIGAISTLNKKRGELGIVKAGETLGVPVLTFSNEELRQVPVPNPSKVPLRAVGTPSVAEASCLLAAGPEGRLLVEKKKKGNVTVAVALSGAIEKGEAI